MKIWRGKSRQGFTIMEVMVALAISLILGVTIMTVLRMAMTSWQRAEERRRAFDTAQLVQQQLREDFEALAIPSAARQGWQNPLPDTLGTENVYSGPPDPPQCLLISDYPVYPEQNASLDPGDESYVAFPPVFPATPTPTACPTPLPGWALPHPLDAHQRLTLVRRITPEDFRRSPALRLAGNGLDDDGDGRVDEESYNLANDDYRHGDRLTDEDLAPTGGLMSVTYILQVQEGGELGTDDESGLPNIPRYILRRGIQSPVSGVLAAPPVTSEDGEPEWDSWPILARDVLYFGLSFQTAFHSNSALIDRPGDNARSRPPFPEHYDDWDTWPPSPSPAPRLASPETMWDSSRGLYDPRRLLEPPLNLFPSPNSFAFYELVYQSHPSPSPAPRSSLLTPTDDIFPRRVYAVLVLDAGPHLTPRALLGRKLEAGEDPARVGLVAITASASRGFAEALKSPQGGELDILRERQHVLLVDADSYEWVHYKTSLNEPPYQRYTLDRRRERATLPGTYSQGQTLLVSGLTFVFEIDVPSYRAPEKGFLQ